MPSEFTMWKMGIDYQEMAAQEQDNPYAQFMAGETLLRAGDFLRAMPFFRKASEMAPHHPESLRGHAICLIMTGQYEQGLALCASLLARLPVDFTTLLISAEAFIGLSQYKEAAEAYRQAALLDYEAVLHMQRKLAMLEEEDLENARCFAKCVVELFPNLQQKFEQYPHNRHHR